MNKMKIALVLIGYHYCKDVNKIIHKPLITCMVHSNVSIFNDHSSSTYQTGMHHFLLHGLMSFDWIYKIALLLFSDMGIVRNCMYFFLSQSIFCFWGTEAMTNSPL